MFRCVPTYFWDYVFFRTGHRKIQLSVGGGVPTCGEGSSLKGGRLRGVGGWLW